MAAPIRLSQQHSCSFDHLVGARKQRRRHLEAEGLGGLEIDHKLKLDRLLNWQIARLDALEDLPDIMEAYLAKDTPAGPPSVQAVVSRPVRRRSFRWSLGQTSV